MNIYNSQLSIVNAHDVYTCHSYIISIISKIIKKYILSLQFTKCMQNTIKDSI